MGWFELERLKREGKGINLPGNRCALDLALEYEFKKADKRIDVFIERQRFDALDEEEKGVLVKPLFLGC